MPWRQINSFQQRARLHASTGWAYHMFGTFAWPPATCCAEAAPA
jgi:hypothetical protein